MWCRQVSCIAACGADRNHCHRTIPSRLLPCRNPAVQCVLAYVTARLMLRQGKASRVVLLLRLLVLTTGCAVQAARPKPAAAGDPAAPPLVAAPLQVFSCRLQPTQLLPASPLAAAAALHACPAVCLCCYSQDDLNLCLDDQRV